ncbi:TPA: efflux transporter outer membrane subunit, partial [Klebsiella variicola]|uniref:efflux transporter outer membrane subunit n=1 Tax=Klebsiella variicola TaxID=244366 RepID=UPI001BD3C417|nr:efflux transporter outer membrane subunit [Klebsiella variicola]HED1713914.1 efflux transporter outer membrane subunit [Klebsiella variicola subsp. variicola]
MKIHLIRLIPAMSLILSACVTDPSGINAESPSLVSPQKWKENASQQLQIINRTWWRDFSDPMMSAAITKALSHNLDLAVAETRVREAAALSKEARSLLFPEFDLAGGGEQVRRLTDLGITDETREAQPQFQVSYEVDLWGRIRSGNKAAMASEKASVYARDAMQLSVAAATARNYITLTSLDAQLKIVQDTLKIRQDSLTLMRRRAVTGYSSELDVTRAQAEYEAVAQQEQSLALAVQRQENAVRFLTGDLPGTVPRSSINIISLPTLSPGLPSSLLNRRPDIAQAESLLIAADASLAASKANLLPQVQLSASVGRLFVEGFSPINVWSVGGSVLAPLFDGDRRLAQVEASTAQRERAVLAYRRVVLNAFSETENALSGVSRFNSEYEHLSAQVTALKDAYGRASRLYDNGYASYIDKLNSQRQLLGTELTWVKVQEERLNNGISLYQVLGGGWTPDNRNRKVVQ